MKQKEIKEILEQKNIKVKKKFGQNFLTDDGILSKIAHVLKPSKIVLEIGPGLGTLTEKLLDVNDKVLAYEIDSDLIDILNDKFKERIILRNIDFLDVSIDEDILKVLKEQNTEVNSINLVANLPYYITTPILIKILEESKIINELVIMVQKEVGDRFIGKPNTKDYNALSVLIQTYMDVEKVCSVPKECFYPMPLVDSVVIHLKRKERIINIINEDTFKKINRLLFRFRRKTINNNLKDIYSKELLDEMYKELKLSQTIRAEALSVEQIVLIANYVEMHK